MGVVLEAVGTSRALEGQIPSSINLAVEAAEAAVERAGTGLRGVGLIINAGVYRDENICEPAMAPFIQRTIEHRVGPGTEILSFDIADGACGMWTATRVASGFIESGAVDRALVVSSDVDPTPSVSQGWDFDPVGGAFLLARGAANEGFAAFHSQTFAKYSNRFEAQVQFTGNSDDRPSHELRIQQSEDFASACGSCAVAAIANFAKIAGFESDTLDLVVPSASPCGFAAALSDAAWLGPGVLSETTPAGPGLAPLRTHTAGPAFSLEAVLPTCSYRAAADIVFVAAGAGISVALCRYRKARAG